MSAVGDAVSNPFVSDEGSRRYAAARPDYGPYLGPLISRLTGVARVPRALDAGCGTGISTRALAAVAATVVGLDRSLPMLAAAHPAPGLSYVAGDAEALPFADGAFDLVAAGSALHWFDVDRFAAEADRVAAPDAALVAHWHWFAASMEGRPGFADWVRETYAVRYPPPPRSGSAARAEVLGAWRRVGVEQFDHTVPFRLNELIDYLTTQSNLRVVIDGGQEPEGAVRAWLAAELAPFFGGAETAAFGFAGLVACYRRA